MPIYPYRCETCGTFAVMRRVAERDAACACPTCAAIAQRMLAMPALAFMSSTLSAQNAPSQRTRGLHTHQHGAVDAAAGRARSQAPNRRRVERIRRCRRPRASARFREIVRWPYCTINRVEGWLFGVNSRPGLGTQRQRPAQFTGRPTSLVCEIPQSLTTSQVGGIVATRVLCRRSIAFAGLH